MIAPAHPRIAVIGAGGQLARAVKHAAPEAMAWPSSRVDIRSAESVGEAFREDRPDLVINCASWTDVDGAESRPAEVFAVNQFGAGIVAEACHRTGARLVHVSTDYVFDGLKAGAYVEDDPPHPLGVYGDSKLWGEREVAQRCPDHVIVRTAWLYGPWSRRNFVDTMVRLTAERDTVDVVNDQWGSPTYTLDLAEALLKLGRSSLRGTFHAVNPGRTNWFFVASVIVDALGRRCRLRAVPGSSFPRAATRPASSVLDISRLRAAGIEMRPWEAALREYLRTYVKES